MHRLLASLTCFFVMSCKSDWNPTQIPENDEYAQELINPDWGFVEDHFGVEMPEALKQFYSAQESVLLADFDIETPIDVDSSPRIHIEAFSVIGDSPYFTVPGNERFLSIASDGGGGTYQFDPKEQDPEVYLYYVDGSGRFTTGMKLDEFLTAPRLETSLDDL